MLVRRMAAAPIESTHGTAYRGINQAENKAPRVPIMPKGVQEIANCNTL